MFQKIKDLWTAYNEAVYRRSQETFLSLESLKLSKDAKNAHYNACWFDGGLIYMFRMIFTLVLVPMMAQAHIQTETFALILNGTLTGEVIMNVIAFGGMPFFMFAMMDRRPRWLSRYALVELMREIRDMENIPELLKKYKWLYVTDNGITFTNVRPSFFFHACTRFPTDYPWEKPYPRDFMNWFGERVLVGIYLRIFWPYFFNPIQCAFLEYDWAAKNIGLKNGQKVLIIGAGAVPHHMRWKKRLGRYGMITALDLDPFVLKDSERMERFIEWVRGLFGKRRWVSKHIPGDADKLPFEAESFDAVIAIRCYYVSVEEALRVLKPNGKILISTCGQVTGVPKYDDPRRKETNAGCIITKLPLRVIEPEAGLVLA